MTPSLDSLINQILPVRAANKAQPPAQTAKLVEAVVLSSTLLKSNTSANQKSGQYQVTLGDGKQQLELVSKQPLPVGTKLLLKLTEDQTAIIQRILERPGSPIRSNSPQPPPAHNEPLLNRPPPTSGETQAPPTKETLIQQQLSQGIKQALPLQDTLSKLAPLLKLLTQTENKTQLPTATQQQLTSLLQILPKPGDLQQPQSLKRALQNSGTFLEAKVDYLAKNNRGPAIANDPAVKNDLKLQLQQALQQVSPNQGDRPAAPGANSGAAASAAALALIPSLLKTAATNAGTTTPKTEEPSQPVIPAATAPITEQTPVGATTSKSSDESLDILLQQLARQLLASLAKTQLNQLESLAHRAASTGDPQSPANSWVMELPIINDQSVDNLELRIDQEGGQQDENGKLLKQWTVMLAFDLHQAGRMNVQLKVVKDTVSTTIWSQIRETHKLVEQEVNALKSNLEKIGVNVQQIECFQGLPKDNRPSPDQPLVDLHT